MFKRDFYESEKKMWNKMQLKYKIEQLANIQK